MQKLMEEISRLSLDAKKASIAMAAVAEKTRELQAKCSQLTARHVGTESRDEYLYNLHHKPSFPYY